MNVMNTEMSAMTSPNSILAVYEFLSKVYTLEIGKDLELGSVTFKRVDENTFSLVNIDLEEVAKVLASDTTNTQLVDVFPDLE